MKQVVSASVYNPLPGPVNSPGWPLNLLRVPVSLSILIDSPIKNDLPLSPVAAFFIPLVESNILFGSWIVAAMDIIVTFLTKIGLACPPRIPCEPKALADITLTMPQMIQLINAYCRGQSIDPYLRGPGNQQGPLGGDEPLFPDNLSVSLMLSAPFADFDGSPDTSFNVPLFEVPGVQGSLIIAILILTARFITEQGGFILTQAADAQATVDSRSLLRYLMQLRKGR